MSFLAKLSSETLSNLAESNFKVVPKKKANLVRQFKEDIDDSGVKGLAYSMKALELSEVCNYLEIDHQDNNPKNRMVLSKRFMESVRETGLEKWFSDCDDLSVIRIICEALGLEVSEEDSCEELCQNAIREIRTHGAQMVLSRMSVAQLKQCCEEMELQNWDLCSSKSALIKAIITQSDVEVKDVARKVAAKKLPIHKCTEYEQLFQHYYREDLSEFCRRHKLKTSGTKKELINRILSFNLGEEESENQTPNTAAAKSKGKKKPAAKKAKSTKKPAAKPASPADEDSEEEQPASDEEQNDEPADEDQDQEESAEEVPPPKVDSKKAKDAKSSTKKPASDSTKDAAKQETKAPAKSSRKSVLESDDEASDEAEPSKDEEPSEEAEPAKPASKSEKKSAEKPLPKKAKLPERSSTAEDPFAPARLDGKTVAIGSAKGFKRTMAEIHRLIESAGGVPDKTLSKRTNFLLVVDPEDTSKKAIVAARKLNVPVVSEDFLRNLSA